MAKECIVCHYQPDPPAKPAGEAENCPKCHAKGSVQDIEESEDEE
jgi:hypothetical protein